jgi:hypothetical protein
LWLRNNDSPQVDMTTGLERVVSFNLFLTSVFQPFSGGGVTLGDDRELGYALADVAYDLALDKSTTTWNLSRIIPGLTAATYPQAALAALQGLVSPNGAWNIWYTAQLPSGLWPINANTGGQNGYGSCTNCSVYGGGTSSVALTNGSANVVFTGVSLPLTPGTYGQNTNPVLAPTGGPRPNPYGIGDNPSGNIWFWHTSPGAFPNPGQGDLTGYVIASCADATHCTLTTPYQGATCSACGYQIPSNSNGNQFSGWGALGYMRGIAGRAMHYAADALSASDPTNSAYARTLALAANNWLLTHAYRTDTNGINLGVDFADCGSPVAQANLQCSQVTSISNSLGFSAEGPLPWFSTYAYNGDPATKAAADALYNQMWAKPGTCPAGSTVCNSSVTAATNYMTQFDPNVDGFMLAGIPPAPKWLGQYFGFGDYSSWPAVRLGAGQQETSQAAYIGFNLKTAPGSTKVRVKVTLPSGDVRERECSSAPCAIGVDPRQGSYHLELTYLSGDGKVLATESSQRTAGF